MRTIFKPLCYSLVGLALLTVPAVVAYSETNSDITPEDDTLMDAHAGGPFDTAYVGSDGFSIPLRNVSAEHRKLFVVGKSLFNQNWVSLPSSVKSRQGLGPLFNAESCSTCHAKDGRGRPPLNELEPMTSMLVRLSLPGKSKNGGVVPDPNYGDQFNPRAILKVKPEGDVRVTHFEEKGKYPDGTEYSLITPIYTYSNLAYGDFPKDMLFSPRVSPQDYGLGLLEAISEKDILSHEDPSDKNGDGVIGRANWVWNEQKKEKALGRFGWKANQPSIYQQCAGAFLGDIGITSPLFPKANCGKKAKDCQDAPKLNHPEIDADSLDQITTYIRFLAPPIRRSLTDSSVQAGSRLFKKINCQSCHTPTFTTSEVADAPELSKVLIHPYTDLLLHNMGKGLADGRPDFEASGEEWRTPPLWGLGLISQVNGHTRFLHDGRARSLEEAVLWHGGEAQTSKEKFMNLNKDERKSVLKFLESI